MFSRRRLILGAGASCLGLGAAAQVFQGRGRPNSSNVINLLCHGDSYCLGVGVTTPVGYLLQTQLNVSNDKPSAITNVGWNGQGFLYVYPTSGSPNNFVADFPISIQPNISASLPNYLVVFTDGNDFAIGGYTVAQSYTAFQTYIAQAIAAGIPAANIIVMMMGVREGLAQSSITAWNSAVLGDAGGYGYQKIRNDLDPNIGTSGNVNNTTYYQSGGIHLTDTGYSIMAALAGPLISPNS